MSSANAVSTENKVADSVKAYAEKVSEERDLKAEKYANAVRGRNIWADAKDASRRKYITAKAHANGKRTSELSFALANYNTTCNSYRDAEINEEIARDSYRGAIFFAGKINQQAAMV